MEGDHDCPFFIPFFFFGLFSLNGFPLLFGSVLGVDLGFHIFIVLVHSASAFKKYIPKHIYIRDYIVNVTNIPKSAHKENAQDHYKNPSKNRRT